MLESSIVKIKHLFSYKIVRYGLVGGMSTLIHILIASLYLYLINESIFQSNVMGFLIAYIFSYLLQSKLVFVHEVNIQKAIKYFIVQFGALVVAILSSELLGTYNSYFKTLVIALFLPLITFIIHKLWTFKETVTDNPS